MHAREWRRDRKQSARDADKRKEPNNCEKKTFLLLQRQTAKC